MVADYIMTIDSDDEETADASKMAQDEAKLNPEFVFDVVGDPYLEFGSYTLDLVKSGSKPVYSVRSLVENLFTFSQVPISVDDIIARRRLNSKRKRPEIGEDEDREEEDWEDEVEKGTDDEDEENSTDAGEERDQGPGEMSEGEEEGEVSSRSECDNDPLATTEEEDETEKEAVDEGASSEGESGSERESQVEKDRKAAFFDQETSASKEIHSSFLSMNLSRPIMKALTSLGFNKPTPIQASTIPVALLGKDIVGNAVTGSGKTAAYTIPMVERLLFREKGKKAAATRCLVLVPTRELAVQCYEVGTKLSVHTDIRFCLVVGMRLFSVYA